MVLCPRVSEGTKIKDSNREDVGPVALNGTVLGGTLLVKREAEWVALRNDESKLKDVLSAIGFPPSKIEQDEKL
jgi:ATP adenylyltransferase